MLFLTEEINGFTCGGTDVLKIIEFVNTLLDIVLFIIPMALIVMVIVDFAKNVIAGRDDEMKKNMNIAFKRILFCAALFLINPLVSFVINFVGENSETYLKCIEIASSDDVWKYKIDWDYYPYEGVETQETFGVGFDGKKKKKYIEYETEKGTIKIWEDGTVEKP